MPPFQCPPITENLMDKKNKQYLFIAGIFIIGLAALSLLAGFLNQQVKAEDENIGAIRPWGLETYTCNATTSPVYKAAGAASSTCEVANMDQIANVDLRFMAYASTTQSTTLSYGYFVSNAATDAATDWYLVGYGQKTFSTSTTITRPFNSIPLSSLAAKKLKVEWTILGAAADTALAVIKDPK